MDKKERERRQRNNYIVVCIFILVGLIVIFLPIRIPNWIIGILIILKGIDIWEEIN